MDCPHGQLARSCEICERDQLIAKMREALEVTAGNLRSLGERFGGQVPYPYQKWLEVVEEAARV